VAAFLQDARRRTLWLVEDLTDAQLRVPLLPIINPILWEIGHVAWFQEKWALRHLRGEPPVLAHGDALYDSAAVAHDTRWDLVLPSRTDTLHYMLVVLGRILDRLPDELSEREAYFHWLPCMHEDMHDEAFTYTRQTLAYPAPSFPPAPPSPAHSVQDVSGDVEIPGAESLLGAPQGELLVFDNEKWAHPVRVEPFRIARAPVTNGQFAEFADDGGYRRRELWSDDGWAWREKAKAEHPVYWSRDGSNWYQRHFDQVRPLSKTLSGVEGPRVLPIIHVNWFEAEAYCRWAKRRLPTEAEWELAAATAEKRRYPWGDAAPTGRGNLDGRALGCVPVGLHSAGDTPEGCRQMLGNVWEWTASTFAPYPGFVVDPYKEYSQPWFTPDYRVLRGGCWATRSRLIRNTWRNFYTRDRRDVFGGFRTCAL